MPNIIQFQGLSDWYWHSANDGISEGYLQHKKRPLLDHLLGVWRQFDENVLSWSPWWSGDEPDGGRGQNCAEVALTEDQYAGKWASHVCSTPLPFICERGF